MQDAGVGHAEFGAAGQHQGSSHFTHTDLALITLNSGNCFQKTHFDKQQKAIKYFGIKLDAKGFVQSTGK